MSQLFKVWLKKAETNYREPMCSTAFADCDSGWVERLGAAAPPSVINLVQLMIPANDPDPCRASVVRGKPNRNSVGGLFQVFVAAMRVQTCSVDRICCGEWLRL